MNIGVFILALACHASAVWGALSFFRVPDAGAISVKRLTSVPSLVSALILVVLTAIYARAAFREERRSDLESDDIYAALTYAARLAQTNRGSRRYYKRIFFVVPNAHWN